MHPNTSSFSVFTHLYTTVLSCLHSSLPLLLSRLSAANPPLPAWWYDPCQSSHEWLHSMHVTPVANARRACRYFSESEKLKKTKNDVHLKEPALWTGLFATDTSLVGIDNKSLSESADSMWEIFHPTKRMKSEVWAYFVFFKNAEGQLVEDNYPVCRTCKKKVAVKGSNTTNLLANLCEHHPQLYS